MEKNNPSSLFFHLSVQLCGVENLSPRLSDVYYETFNSDPSSTVILKILLDKYQKILNSNGHNIIQRIQKEILDDNKLKDLVRNIIKLWYLGYCSGIATLTELKGGGFYFHYEALIWKVAHAHPPGLSGGYYGYWKYKPET